MAWSDDEQVFEEAFKLYQMWFIVGRDDAVDAEFFAHKMCEQAHLRV